MSTAVSSGIPMLGRRIHVKKLSQEGEETDESYWLWLDFPETIKGLRSKCMEAFEPPRDHTIRFIHDEDLLCVNSLEALPNKCEIWVQFVPKNAPLTPISARKTRKKRPVLAEEEENVDPCLLVGVDAGSPIRKRQRLDPRPDISNIDFCVSTPPSPSEPFKPLRTESSFLEHCQPPCNSLKPITLQEVPGRNRRNRSNASASFFEPNGPPAELITRPDPENPLMYSETPEDDGVPVIAWEMENHDESYYGYGILSFDKPRHDWVPSIAFDLLPQYSTGVTNGIDFNLLVCDVPYDVTVGEIRAALAANLALDPERLPQGDFQLVRKGQNLQDWMTCVPAYLGDGDAVFIRFGKPGRIEQQPEHKGDWSTDDNLLADNLDEIELVKLPCDSDEE